jgi:uncharacterized protein YjbI with pentapeptide repeats
MAHNSTSTKDAAEFEPPKYLASLIAAVNDGAKMAQSGALASALVGVYLLATAFSANDEDLLRGRAVTISQIGASLPPAFSFAIAPLVFVFLHVYTLARYDMLASNVRQFIGEMQKSLVWEVDRERCRQLLANVEFVQALVAPRNSPLYSPLWRWLVRTVVAGFPILVLVLIQISALRYQSFPILVAQRFGLLVDLFALVWFFWRNPLKGPKLGPLRRRSLGTSTVTSLETRAGVLGKISAAAMYWLGLLWLPAAVIGLNLYYLKIVPQSADAQKVRYFETREVRDHYFITRWALLLVDAFYHNNPLDVLFCYKWNWGCRYLRLDNLTLVEHVWDEKAIEELRGGRGDTSDPSNHSDPLAAIQGLALQHRFLRFASLQGSMLFAVDLTGADLTGAQLHAAVLSRAILQDTLLQKADLQDALLPGAQLKGAVLTKEAHLQGADLAQAQLQGADLRNFSLTAVRLSGAALMGADLDGAHLAGAKLVGTQLQGASLRNAYLLGADLTGAQLQGADLQGAKLAGARMGYVHAKDRSAVSCADLRQANEKNEGTPTETDLELADLGDANFEPLTPQKMDDLEKNITKDIPGGEARDNITGFLSCLRTIKRFSHPIEYTATPLTQNKPPKKPLVLATNNFLFGNHKVWIITNPTPDYTKELTTLLADHLASADPAIANGIARRVLDGLDTDDAEHRAVDTVVACQLLKHVKEHDYKLGNNKEDDLSKKADFPKGCPKDALSPE